MLLFFWYRTQMDPVLLKRYFQAQEYLECKSLRTSLRISLSSFMNSGSQNLLSLCAIPDWLHDVEIRALWGS